MLYVILGRDAPDSLAVRRRVRPAHLTRMNILLEQGRLVLAGPHPAIDSIDPGQAGYTGSLIVAEFESLDEAHAWASQDPYVTEGVFASIEVLPFVQVLP